MLDGLKPYPAYKDSGVPWLGKVPEHWELRRMKTVLRERVEKGYPEEPLLAATQSKGVVKKDTYENRTVLAMKDLHLLKLVRTGDFVISLRSFQGGIEFARDQGIISPAYTVLFPRNVADHSYLAALFKSRPFIENLGAFVTGIRQGQTIDYEKLARVPIPLPPPEDRTAIARFLWNAGRQMHRLVSARQRLIGILDEARQAAVHRLVTGGIGPRCRRVDSGSEWYGAVPEGWSVVSLGRVVRSAVDGPHHSPTYVDEGVPFLSARNIKVDRWSLEDAKFISPADFEVYSRRVVPERGDVLYTKGGTTGVARVVDLDFSFQVWVHVAVLKVIRTRILPEYLALVLNSPRCYEQSQLLTRGATNQDLGLTRMKQILLPLPPLDEQEEILRVASAATADLVAGIASARREIQLALELRARLIADVVTGRVDVLGAAEALPADDGHASLTAGFDSDGEEADEDATSVASLDEADA